MVVKKYKKRKADSGLDALGLGASAQVIKDPFIYNEEVTYPELYDPRFIDQNINTIYDVMMDVKDVMPFGYPTEQFFR